MDNGTEAEAGRTFVTRIVIEGGPPQHVVVTSAGAFWVNGEPVEASHPTIEALRRSPVAPEWVKSQQASPRWVEARRSIRSRST